MEGNHVYLNELNASSRNYKVKVRVVDKARPTTSPQKGVTYQNVVLQDDKGNRMRGALFGDQIDSYEDAIVYNGTYEISNAPIRHVNSQWTSRPGELDFQMGFGGQTVIQPTGDQMGPILPNFIALSQIPRAATATERFDVLGVILFADAAPRHIVTKFGAQKVVRDIIIADHSSRQHVILSAWADLAQATIPALNTWSEKFGIVGFTALKVYDHQGFSLSTTMSTRIIEEPMGEKANALASWVARNQEVLSDMQSRVLGARDPNRQANSITIAELKCKRPWNTVPEDRVRLNIIIPDADFGKVNAYLGCSYCNTRGEEYVPAGTKYLCKKCGNKDSVSTPKITFNFEATDGTGSLSVTAFTGNSGKLLKIGDADMFKMKHTDNREAFQAIKDRLSRNHVIIEMGPSANLARNNILQWVLKNVHNSPEEEGDTNNANADDNTENPDQEEDTSDIVQTSSDDGKGKEIAVQKGEQATTSDTQDE